MSKLTSKQEKFCQNIVGGMTQYDAYIDAYDTKTTDRNTIDSNASQLADDTKIIQRIKVLRERVVNKVEITLEKLLSELEDAKEYALSEEKKDLANFIKAIQEQGKLSGLYVDKKDITSKGRSIAIVPEAKEDWGK